MRLVRTFAVVAAVAIALTGCGSSGETGFGPDGIRDLPLATTSPAPRPTAMAIKTALPAPLAIEGWRQGNLCEVITADIASQALGMTLDINPGVSTDLPGKVDECNYMRTTSPTIYMVNVLVVTPPSSIDEFVRQTRSDLAHPNDLNPGGVTDFTIPGVSHAFYGNSRAVVVKGEKVVTVHNQSVGGFPPDTLVAFAAAVAATVS